MVFKRQRPIAVVYKGITLDCGYKLDIVEKDGLNEVNPSLLFCWVRFASPNLLSCRFKIRNFD